tara:strand:+ start:1952 stop:2386 length:435 start_codon:yes stop_codon:yes gene_type:complete
MNYLKEEIGTELEQEEITVSRLEKLEGALEEDEIGVLDYNTLTNEQLKELEKLHYIEPKKIDNTILTISHPEWDYDDSFMDNSDKELLLMFLKDRLFISKPWADNILIKIIVRKEYGDIVKSIDIEQYKQEKNNPINSFLSMLE